ncbi:MAG: Xaa-Pro peptidase family protein [Gemmataceae bacterium]
MLTLDGCRDRRRRLWDRLGVSRTLLRLSDPLHLAYLAGFVVEPISLNAGFRALLELYPDGSAHLIHDDRLKSAAEAAHVERRTVAPWYDGHSPGKGPRQLAWRACLGTDGRIHDAPDDPDAPEVVGTLAQMRRQKDADEIALLRRCMAATDAGHAWARANVRAGLTELEVYAGIVAACQRVAGRAVIVYGDFAVSPGPARRGGPASDRVLVDGDLLILDFSVVIDGYRSDFTNTLCVGGQPSEAQRRHFAWCLEAMQAGEAELRAGASCLDVYRAVRGVFEKAGVAEAFPHHAGHGLGLTHPEAPFFVREADETLLAGDVVTLEPGLYIDGMGGMRIEHNYLITPTGFERLSNHAITLV